MMASEKVSVIMGIYNCADTLPRAIESILSQTYTNWELILCDDASTDNTYEVAASYQSRHPDKIRLVKNRENSKLSFSLNHCLENASGGYIARMDADDVSAEERLETQARFLDEHPEFAVCGTDMVRFDDGGEYGYYRSVEHPDRNTLMHEVPFCHATIMMRREVYDALGGYTVSKRTERGQDVDLWFRFFAKGYRGENLHLPLYKVREDENFVRRGSVKNAWNVTKTRFLGFRLLKYPLSKYYLIPRPLISHFVPRQLKLRRRNRKEKTDR